MSVNHQVQTVTRRQRYGLASCRSPTTACQALVEAREDPQKVVALPIWEVQAEGLRVQGQPRQN
jgi:hypothetical protein